MSTPPGDAHFKLTCAHCGLTIVVMSEIMRSKPASAPPRAGDVVRCDACTHLSRVDDVQGTKVICTSVTIPNMPKS